MVKKRKRNSQSKQLQKEMLNYYKNLNKQSKEKKQEEKEISSKQLKKEMLDYYKSHNEDNKKQKINKMYLIFLIFLGFLILLYSYFLLNWAGRIMIITVFITVCLGIFNKKNTILWMELTIGIITVYLLFAQTTIMNLQIDINNEQKEIERQQTRILEETSQLNYPKVLLVSYKGYRSYKLENIREVTSSSMVIGITNIGKAKIPSLTIYPAYTNKEFYGSFFNSTTDTPNSHFSIKELESLQWNKEVFKFDILPEINVSNLSIGEKNIAFQIDCPVCRPPVEFQNITLCVYKEKPIECGEKWVFSA